MKSKKQELLTFSTEIEVLGEEAVREDVRFRKVKIWLMSTGYNEAKGLIIPRSVVEKGLDTLKNVPILAVVPNEESLEADFEGHGEKGVQGKSTKAIGVIPETNNAKFEKKLLDGEEVDYLTVEGLVWSREEKAINIIERSNGIKSQSMELSPDLTKFDLTDEGIPFIREIAFNGACVLGEGVRPAMVGSTLELFSQENGVDKIVEEIQTRLNQYTSSKEKEEEKNMDKEKVENFEEDLVCSKCGTSIKEGEEECSKCGNDKFITKEEFDKKVKEEESATKGKTKGNDATKTDYVGEKKVEEPKDVEPKKKESKTVEPKGEESNVDFAEAIEKLENKIKTLEEENANLVSFKEDVLVKEENDKKEEVLTKYEALKNLEEYKAIVDKIEDFTSSELDKELALVFVANANSLQGEETKEEELEESTKFNFSVKEEESEFSSLLEKYGLTK